MPGINIDCLPPAGVLLSGAGPRTAVGEVVTLRLTLPGRGTTSETAGCLHESEEMKPVLTVQWFRLQI